VTESSKSSPGAPTWGTKKKQPPQPTSDKETETNEEAAEAGRSMTKDCGQTPPAQQKRGPEDGDGLGR